MQSTQLARHTRQGGAALAVSLILLLVMTIIGVSAMNGARLEINMAGSMQDEQVALRRSEQALLEAQQQIANIITGFDGSFEFVSDEDDEDGIFETGTNPEAAQSDWSALAGSMTGPKYSDNSKDDDDAMVIHYLGPEKVLGSGIGVSNEPEIPGDTAYMYRISTRSATDGNAVRVIEATFASEDKP